MTTPAFLRKKTILMALALGSAGFAQFAAAQGQPTCPVSLDLVGQGFVTYGDGLSYSLIVPQYDDPARTDLKVGIADAQNCITIADGNGGDNTGFGMMDDGYETPNGSTQTFFSTQIEDDPQSGQGANTRPQPEFGGDYDYTWDIRGDSLEEYLDGAATGFLFFNNQIGADGGFDSSLAAWAQVYVTQTVAGGPDIALGVYDFTNQLSQYNILTNGGGGTFFGDPGAYTSLGVAAGDQTATNSAANPDANVAAGTTDYVLSGGQLCIDYSFDPPVPVDQSFCGSGISNPRLVEHNLGTEQAPYLVLFPELNALLASLFGDDTLDLTQYALHVDFRIGCDPDIYPAIPGPEVGDDPIPGDEQAVCLGEEVAAGQDVYGKNINNGDEGLYLVRALVDIPQVPEPATILLLGLGLAGLAGRRLKSRA